MFLDFFIGYKKDLPEIGISAWKAEGPKVSTRPAIWPTSAPGFVQEFNEDPKVAPPDGALWVNHSANELRVRLGGKTFTVGILKEAGHNRLTPMIQIQEYLIFILQMAAAFGGGFQVPVIVALIATIGVASSKQMAKARKYVWFGIAIAAALITPTPDATTMMFLMVPMIFLFEAGLISARLIERERAQARSNDSATT
jgi:Sec-independent protein translocase protein (TatC)